MKLPESWTTVTLLSKILAVILFVSLPFIGFYFGYKYKQSKLSENTIISIPTTSVIDPNSNSNSITSKNESVLIFSEEIDQIDSSGRGWVVKKISRIVGDNKPEELIPSIGRVGEYPLSFLISPDKQILLANLENRLVKLDLKNKKIRDLLNFEYAGNYRGFNFSPDSKKLFIWDQDDASNERIPGYTIYVYNIATGVKTILKKGIAGDGMPKNGMIVFKWRTDNIIILGDPKGDFSELWIYNLNTNVLYRKSTAVGILNENGTVMVNQDTYVPDPCNDYSGTDIGSYVLYDPITLLVLDRIDGNKKVVHLVAISPNGDQVIYEIQDPVDTNKIHDSKDCFQSESTIPNTSVYYSKKIGETPMIITDVDTLIKSWGVNTEAKLKYNQDGSVYIQKGNQRIDKSNAFFGFEIVSQFYQ